MLFQNCMADRILVELFVPGVPRAIVLGIFLVAESSRDTTAPEMGMDNTKGALFPYDGIDLGLSLLPHRELWLQ